MKMSETEIAEIARRVAEAVCNELKEFRLLNREELAKKLGISLPTVDRLVAQDKIPSICVGQRRVFNFNKVVAALETKSKPFFPGTGYPS